MKVSEDFNMLFSRDLDRLKYEISSYSNESSLWLKQGEIKNSAGNLAMHICGNLQHFIGAVLMKTSYVRNRDFEFAGTMSRKELIAEIDTTSQVIKSYFESVTDDDFEEDYPIEVFGYSMSKFHFLIHLQGHLNYHLGQVNYHRRIISK